MLKKYIEKLKKRKKQLESYSTNNKTSKINILKHESFTQIDIDDYISITEFVEKQNESQEYEVLEYLCNCVIWNSSKQLVNKGTYYVVPLEDVIYNILITDDKIVIDERVKISFDETNNKENIIQEKVITFFKESQKYSYYIAKHESNGNTYYTKYYNKNRNYSLGCLDLSTEEAYADLVLFFTNLRKLQEISIIIDIEYLEDKVLGELSKEQKRLKKEQK